MYLLCIFTEHYLEVLSTDNDNFGRDRKKKMKMRHNKVVVTLSEVRAKQ